MDLRRFITLKTVVEEGSFLRASQKLCCTQSTVTFHIQQLEQEFSVQLFEKIGRRMCLTREGKKLLPHIYELTRVMDTLREAAKKESDPDGELRVISGETLLSYRMPQVLQRFRQRAPKVRLSLQSLNCYVIRDALLNDEADVGVFYRVGNDDALNRRELGEQPLALVASPQIADVDFTCGELIELPFGEQSQTITAMCAHHAGKAVSPAMHTFIQCVEECFLPG
ncbi:MAG: LysR family transcriptional regulator [Escherichia coli]|nr:LysR family transcriptional regulator [Escherichia coli]